MLAAPLAVQDYLPPALHATFMAVVTEFLWLPWKEAMASSVEGATQGGSQVGGPCPASPGCAPAAPSCDGGLC